MVKWRRRRLAACIVAVTAGLGCGLSSPDARAGEPQRTDAARLMNDLMTGRGNIGGPFSLTDQQGNPSGTAQWHGKIVLLYFGYMYCPDACPTDLAAIAAAINALGPMGSEVQPVFVTLDPSRDKPDLIGRYAETFHPRFAALSGSETQTREVATAYKVYFEKVPKSGTVEYSIDHTSFTYVLDAEGNYAGFFPPGTSGARIAERVRAMISAR
jgi:cytochrome oxidase Cu insertion factor (SCO1/SenC/PrrC family)